MPIEPYRRGIDKSSCLIHFVTDTIKAVQKISHQPQSFLTIIFQTRVIILQINYITGLLHWVYENDNFSFFQAVSVDPSQCILKSHDAYS